MAGTTAEYISHHLSFLASGDGFWAVHLDTLFFLSACWCYFPFRIFSSCEKCDVGSTGKIAMLRGNCHWLGGRFS